MQSFTNSGVGRALAVCLLTFSAGCAGSKDNVGPVAVSVPLPALPADLSERCVRPLLDDDARVALVDSVMALENCANRHARTVAFYEGLRAARTTP